MPLHYSRTLYLAPHDDCRTPLLELVAAAQHSVHVLIYALTLPPLVDALLAAHARGLDVQVVADLSQSGGPAEAAQLARLDAGGVPVVLSESTEHAIMHEKVVVVDDTQVAYGSYNFSTGAQHQDNILVVERNTEICALLEEQFREARAWGQEHLVQPFGPETDEPAR